MDKYADSSRRTFFLFLQSDPVILAAEGYSERSQHEHATPKQQDRSRIGQPISVLFVLAAIYQQAPFLGLIGVFIFMAAGAEIRSLAPKTPANSAFIRSHMTAKFTSLLSTSTVANALEDLSHTDDELIVVLDSTEVKGIITRDELRANAPDALLSTLSVTRVPACRINDTAEHGIICCP